MTPNNTSEEKDDSRFIETELIEIPVTEERAKALYKSKDITISQKDVDKALDEAKKIDPRLYELITAVKKRQSTFWDEATGTFITEGGNLITRAQIIELLEKSLIFTEDIATDFALKEVASKAMFMQMREVIKREFIRQYLVGIGGIENMTPRDWGSIGGMLKSQYSYLRTFTSDVVKGTLSESQMRARINMFSNSAREAHSRAKARVASRKFNEVSWDIEEGDNCAQCLERSQMGPVEVGPRGGFMVDGEEYFPGDGNSDCLTNCRCSLSYTNSDTGEEYDL